MATPSLRPMGVGEILDASIKLCTRNWKALTLTVIAIVLPLVVLDVLITASVDPDSFRLNGSSDGSDASAAATGGAAVLRLLIGLTVDVCILACFKAVSDAWLGERPSPADSLRHGLRRLLPFIGLGLLIGLGIVILFLLLALLGAALGPVVILFLIAAFVGVIWFAPVWAVANAVLVLERIGPIRSIRRAADLVRGRWWPTFFTFFVAALLMIVVFFIFGFIVGIVLGLGTNDDSEVAAAVAILVVYVVAFSVSIPYGTAVSVLIYYDRRVRKEGLDLQLAGAPAGDEWQPADDGSSAGPPGWSRPADDAPGRGQWPPPEAPRGPGGL